MPFKACAILDNITMLCYFIAPLRDEEDEMLQLAIQQSLLEYQQDPAQMMRLQALRDSRQMEDDDLQR